MPFQTGLFACMDDKAGCCDTMFCPPCQVGRQCSALDGMVNEGNCVHCMIALFTGAYAIYACCIRNKVNEKYQIGESFPLVCLQGLCCYGCSMCQTHRELTLQNAWPGGACYSKQPYNSVMN